MNIYQVRTGPCHNLNLKKKLYYKFFMYITMTVMSISEDSFPLVRVLYLLIYFWRLLLCLLSIKLPGKATHEDTWKGYLILRKIGQTTLVRDRDQTYSWRLTV